MDWTLAIDINRKALLQMLAGLFEMITGGGPVARHVHSAIRAKLLPAEAAARRLIAIAAVGLVVVVQTKRTGPTVVIPTGSGDRMPSFRLLDPRRIIGPVDRRTRGNPGIRPLDGSAIPHSGRTVPSPDDSISAKRLERRLRALLHALNTIPAQARRLARLTTEMERPVRPMRPGRPPGFRAGGQRPIDVLLADCHELALMALAEVPP